MRGNAAGPTPELEEEEKVEVVNYAHVHIRAPFLFLPRETEKKPAP